MYRIQITDPKTRETSYVTNPDGSPVEIPANRAGEITAKHMLRMHRASHPRHDAQLVTV